MTQPPINDTDYQYKKEKFAHNEPVENLQFQSRTTNRQDFGAILDSTTALCLRCRGDGKLRNRIIVDNLMITLIVQKNDVKDKSGCCHTRA